MTDPGTEARRTAASHIISICCILISVVGRRETGEYGLGVGSGALCEAVLTLSPHEGVSHFVKERLISRGEVRVPDEPRLMIIRFEYVYPKSLLRPLRFNVLALLHLLRTRIRTLLINLIANSSFPTRQILWHQMSSGINR